jgi:hypothetical protein
VSFLAAIPLPFYQVLIVLLEAFAGDDLVLVLDYRLLFIAWHNHLPYITHADTVFGDKRFHVKLDSVVCTAYHKHLHNLCDIVPPFGELRIG